MSLLRKFWHSFVFLALFCPFTSQSKTLACNQFLSSENDAEASSVTDQFAAYLAVLYEKGVINPQQLRTMQQELEQKKPLSNPMTEANTKSKESIHYEYLDSYINSESVDREKLLILLIKLLTAKEKEEQERNRSKDNTRQDYVQIRLHPVKGGTFNLRKDRYRQEEKDQSTSIDYNFEVMHTSVTQHMWQEIMGDLPIEASENLQSDLPIVYVTLWSMMEFANRLSVLHGYEPAYDYSHSFQFTGNAATGTLQPIDSIEGMTDPEEENFRIKTMKIIRNSLSKKAYRFPTCLEQQFLLTDRGRSNTNFFTGVDESTIQNTAWYADNADKTSHPVAELQPLKIDGFSFYDLYGNVIELCFNEQKDDLHSQGGYYDVEASLLKTDVHFLVTPSLRDRNMGFRLVRTLP